MLQRALRAGLRARYALGDAWFGCKENIDCCLENDLIGIFQMKRGNLAYQYQGHTYAASQLYVKVQRQMRPLNRRARYKTASLVVRINLETDDRQPPRWVEVRLVFSAPVRATPKNPWVIFQPMRFQLAAGSGCTKAASWTLLPANGGVRTEPEVTDYQIYAGVAAWPSMN